MPARGQFNGEDADAGLPLQDGAQVVEQGVRGIGGGSGAVGDEGAATTEGSPVIGEPGRIPAPKVSGMLGQTPQYSSAGLDREDGVVTPFAWAGTSIWLHTASACSDLLVDPGT